MINIYNNFEVKLKYQECFLEKGIAPPFLKTKGFAKAGIWEICEPHQIFKICKMLLENTIATKCIIQGFENSHFEKEHAKKYTYSADKWEETDLVS